MFVRYPPGWIRYEGDRPVALLGVRGPASRFRLVDLPLGMPTSLARTGRGTWASYPFGAEVVVVHPDGAVSGPPAEAAAEVGRLAGHDRQGELDRQAARAILHLLTGDGADRGGRRLRTRIWSLPAKAYWVSGPYNDHGHSPSGPGPLRLAARHRPRDAGPQQAGGVAVGTQPALGAAGDGAPENGRHRTRRGLTGSARHRRARRTADTVRRAERAGAELERALERPGGGWAGLHVRPESVLDPIRAQLLGADTALNRSDLRRAA